MEKMMALVAILMQNLLGAESARWAAAFQGFMENPWKTVENLLTPTTFGSAIQPPFDGCVLVEDGPGDELPDLSQLELQPILQGEEASISFKEAVSRSKDWGQRAALALRDAGNADQIPESVWKVGEYVVCGKTVWRRPYGPSCAWYVFRSEFGFYCYYVWFAGAVHSGGRRLVPRK